MDDNTFKNMKRTFDSHGYTIDPNAVGTGSLVGDALASKDKNGKILSYEKKQEFRKQYPSFHYTSS